MNNYENANSGQERKRDAMQVFTQNILYESTQNSEENRSLVKKMFYVLLAPLLTAFVMFIIYMIDPAQYIEAGPSKIMSHIIFFTGVPIMLSAMLYAQKLNLTGTYGETILLLVPAFVWLLPPSAKAIGTMIWISFSLLIISFLIFTAGLSMRYVKTNKNIRLLEKLMPTVMKLSFVLVGIVSTLMLSIITINWGQFAMGFAYVDGIVGATFSSRTWILFVAFVTISIALILVIFGLVQSILNAHQFVKIKSEESLIRAAVNTRKKGYVDSRRVGLRKDRYQK